MFTRRSDADISSVGIRIINIKKSAYRLDLEPPQHDFVSITSCSLQLATSHLIRLRLDSDPMEYAAPTTIIVMLDSIQGEVRSEEGYVSSARRDTRKLRTVPARQRKGNLCALGEESNNTMAGSRRGQERMQRKGWHQWLCCAVWR